MKAWRHGGMSSHQIANPEPEPLYDAPYMVFIYAGWVAGSYVIGDTAGLIVLVAATAVLTIVSERRPDLRHPRSFAADFDVVLLFCAASLGVGVFLVGVLSAAPLLSVVTLGLAIVAVTGARIMRRGPAHRLS